MIVIVAGGIGRSVTGGQAWANLQYLIGLRALGHDVYYLEDVGDWSQVYNWDAEQHTDSLDYPAAYVSQSLKPYGFDDRWIYRAGSQARGLSINVLRELCGAADLLLVRGIPFIVWRPEYDLPKRRAFIDVDPGFTQIRLAQKEPAFAETLGRCEMLFTIGQRIGQSDCPIPLAGREWRKTVSPIALEAWPASATLDDAPFTTIIRWRGFKDVAYEGHTYGQRDKEFPRFLDLPQRTQQPLLIALTGGSASRLRGAGWNVVSGRDASRDTETYCEFIRQSRGEFGIAKHCYVATRSGWFSDRSACYLASARPVVVQDCGHADWLPTGAGVLTFRDVTDAAQRISEVDSDYARHSAAARRVAESHFDTSHVLPRLLEAAAP